MSSKARNAHPAQGGIIAMHVPNRVFEETFIRGIKAASIIKKMCGSVTVKVADIQDMAHNEI